MQNQKKSYYQRKKEQRVSVNELTVSPNVVEAPLTQSTQPTQVTKINPNSDLKEFHNIVEGVILPSTLETDSDITELSQLLLSITNKCIPLAVKAYEATPKKSSADALNLFISQSRELANDLRSLQNKKIQTNKIIRECITPVFQQIHAQMLNLPHFVSGLSSEEYEEEINAFMKLAVKSVCEKLKEML